MVERRGDDAPDGVLVTRQDEPELWALVDEVSIELGVPAPDDLRLVADVNAFVHQDTRLLGLVGGRRHMGIGLPLLHVLTVDQLRGVIGHELGHYAGGDTRVSALVHRAGATVARTSQHLGRGSLLSRLFAAYARLYRGVSLKIRRRQELRADAGSVRVVGREAHVRALVEARAAAAAWDFFVSRATWCRCGGPEPAPGPVRPLPPPARRAEPAGPARGGPGLGSAGGLRQPVRLAPVTGRTGAARAAAAGPGRARGRPARADAAPRRAGRRAAGRRRVSSRVVGALPQDRSDLDVEVLDPDPYAAGLLIPVRRWPAPPPPSTGVKGRVASAARWPCWRRVGTRSSSRR